MVVVCVCVCVGGGGGGGGLLFSSFCFLSFPNSFSWRRLDITEILLTGPLNQLKQNTFLVTCSILLKSFQTVLGPTGVDKDLECLLDC